MQIFLSGPMGSGKSTVGKVLAELSGLPYIDLDEQIVDAAGAPIPDIFRTRGEVAFRALECDTLRALLSQRGSCVLALGGGAVTNKALRRELIALGFVVTLDASSDVLAARVGTGQGRPLLSGSTQDLVAKLDALRQERADAYAECHLRVDTSTRSARVIAEQIWQAAKHAPVLVPLGLRTYPVEVGSGARKHLVASIKRLADVSAVLFVSDTTVDPLWCEQLAQDVAESGFRVSKSVLSPGESAKHLLSVETLWNAALDAGLDRKSLVVGVGGGVIGDLAGFVAATTLRGMRVAHVPTTLLSMVDSSVGGKTGFDTRHGKNLIGAFHQPSFVLADVDTLSSLPIAERRAGLAEVAKSAWIEGEDAVAMLERDAAALVLGDAAATERAIRMSVRLKSRIVTEDEHEAGKRAWLNLGHTLGHAIEAYLGYEGMRHGEAVALGMVAAFRIARHLGRIDDAGAQRATRLLEALQLPTQVSSYLHEGVFAFLASDKKRTGTTLSYVVPGLPGVIAVEKLSTAEVASLLRRD